MDELTLLRLMEEDEGENLEFKTSLPSRKEIGEYSVGVGNAGGGWLIIGVTDTRPRRILGISEQTSKNLQKIRDSVLDSTGIKISAEPVRTETGLVLAVRIPSRPRGQIFSTVAGKYLMRSGDELRGMTLAEIDRIRLEELVYVDHLAESVGEHWRAVLDPVEIVR